MITTRSQQSPVSVAAKYISRSAKAAASQMFNSMGRAGRAAIAAISPRNSFARAAMAPAPALARVNSAPAPRRG